MSKPIKAAGTRVAVYAAFPQGGAYYSGATGQITKNYWLDEDKEKNEQFVTVTMDGSGDVIPAHRNQLRVLVPKKTT